MCSWWWSDMRVCGFVCCVWGGDARPAAGFFLRTTRPRRSGRAGSSWSALVLLRSECLLCGEGVRCATRRASPQCPSLALHLMTAKIVQQVTPGRSLVLCFTPPPPCGRLFLSPEWPSAI